MVVYDVSEQRRLRKEWEDKMREAYRVYYRNIEEIFNYGCQEEQMRESFIKDCMELLEETTYTEISNEHNRKKYPDAIRVVPQ